MTCFNHLSNYFNILDETEFCNVVIPGTEQQVIRSRINNREYRIFTAVPAKEPPPSGFPVIYLLDANALFGTMVEAIRIQSKRPEKTGVIPAVIIGIGYCGDDMFNPARHYDFTLPVPESELPANPGGSKWPEQGGAENFLDFIEEELKPIVEKRVQIDSSRQTILGHSLGGLFVLHTLFTRPASFGTYIAGSPSIHWNRRIILKEENNFSLRLQKESFNINLMLTAAELEKKLPFFVNETVKELSDRLSVLKNRGLQVKFLEFKDENHVSALPLLINQSLRFALSPK